MLEDRFPGYDDAVYYLDRMFGTREGYVAVAFGHNPRTMKPRFAKGDFREQKYAWPADRDQLIEDVDNIVNMPDMKPENVEIFICPALRKTPSRVAGTHAPLHWIWCDIDHTPTEGEMDRIRALGAMTILSGTEGHRHVYIELAKPVSRANHQALCRMLRDVLNGDSKISENDLLRLPGTLNWKTTSPTVVELKATGRVCRNTKAMIETMSFMTGASEWKEYKEDAVNLSSTSTDVPDGHPAPALKSLPKPVRVAFREGSSAQGGSTQYSRSDAVFELVSTCKEQGVSRADTHALVWTFPPAIDKWSSQWRISNDVDRIWQKAANPTKADDDTPIDRPEDDDGTEGVELPFKTFRQLYERVANAPSPQYLFEGIISEGDYGMLSAEDKAGKSLIMLDAAVSAASGTAWMNKFECRKPGPVIICAGEGSERKQVRRIQAIAEYKGLTGEDMLDLPIHMVLRVPQIKDEDHLDELEDKIRTTQPVLVIIDPFYLAAGGVDFAKLSEVGQALKPLQDMCQRYGAALLISHHQGKTSSNGSAIQRTSGVGLTAWGRFLIGITKGQSTTDPVTKRTVVGQEWEIQGDEVMTDKFNIERTVWVDDPNDLGSAMHYELTLPNTEDIAKAKPLKNAKSMERISEVLSENLGGIGTKKIMKELGDRGPGVSASTVGSCLEQLILHGYVQEGRKMGNGSTPFLHIKSFLRTEHQPPTSTVRTSRRATAKEFDFTNVGTRPGRRRAKASV